MIIVEGPDGAGKTTLIKHMQQRWPDLEIAPRVVTKDAEAMTDLQAWVNENLGQGFQYKIFDRHRLISEFIYGPILRQQQEPGFNNWLWVRHSLYRLYQLKPIIIYCLPQNFNVVNFNVHQGDDNRVVQDHIEAIYTSYCLRSALDEQILGGFNVMVWDYTSDGRESEDPLECLNVMKYQIDYARERAQR